VIVKATIANGASSSTNYEQNFAVTVGSATPVAGITLNHTTAQISKGGEKQLIATIAPPNASDKGITWSSSDLAVATVDATGLVSVPTTATVGATATITAMSNNNNLIKATCAVEVVDPQFNIGDVLALNKIIETRGKPANIFGLNPDLTGATIPSGWQPSLIVWSGTSGSTNRRLIEIHFGVQLDNDKDYPIDVSPFKKLQVLDIKNTYLGTLDVTALTELKELNCEGPQLGTYLGKLTELDLSKNTLLEKLDCSRNELTKLDLTANTALKELDCRYNQLTALDVTHVASQLTAFNCSYNRLLSIDVTGSTFTISSNGNGQDPRVIMQKNNADDTYEALVTMNAPSTAAFNGSLTYSAGKLSTKPAGTSSKPATVSYNDEYIGRTNVFSGTINLTYYDKVAPNGITLTSPTNATVGIPYTFAATINQATTPTTAPAREIVWSIDAAATAALGTPATAAISNNQLIISTAGDVVVTGTVVNGEGLGHDYTQNFTITTGQPAYNISDINAINALIDAGSLPSSWTKTNPVDGSGYNGSWTAVSWSNTTDNQRIVGLNLSGESLSGNLDVTALTALTSLDVSGNALTGLNVTGLTNLSTLNCSSNQLIALDLSTCAGLTTFTGSGQTPAAITLTGISPTKYETAISLPQQLDGLAMGIAHNFVAGGGKLISTDNTVTSTPFTTTTGLGTYDLAGTLTLNYVHFYAVTGITNVPFKAGIGESITLVGAVTPSNANFQSIVWSLISDGGTGVTLSGDVLDATAVGVISGTVTVRATIVNGMSNDPTDTNRDYTQDCLIFVDTNIPATSVVINEAPVTGSVTIPFGGTSQLTATVVPVSATNQTVAWSSSVPSVATVHPVSGVVTAVSQGSTVITAKSADGGFIATCPVTVAAAILVTSVTLDQSPTATIGQGGTLQLTATVAPNNASNKNVTWSTSDPAIATVSATGLVTVRTTATVGLTATITATAADGSGYSDQCIITVDTPVAVTGVSLNQTTTTIDQGGTLQLTATVTPGNATIPTVTWSSDNTAVATVSSTGLVSVLAGATIGAMATITVTSVDDPSVTATCQITVTANVPATGVTVSPTSATLTPGLTQQLTATVTSATSGVNASNQTISSWYSDNTSVATVSATGLVTAGTTTGTATITATSQEGSFTGTATITVSNAPTTYAVTVSSVGSGASGGGNYAAGATVSINAGTAPAGYTFSYWSASPSVTFANANLASTSFTMPASAVTVTANFVATPGPGPVPNPPTDPDLVDIYNAIDLVQFATISIPQSAGNNQTSVSQWLESYLHELFVQQNYYVTANVTGFSAFEPAVAGSIGNPNGTNGSVTFSAIFSKGSHTVQVTYLHGRIVATTLTSNESVSLQPLKAVADYGSVVISGLFAGDNLRIYSISGKLVYNSKAAASEVRVNLSSGIYIITCGNRTVKVSVR
jgi:uncharacterized protein YjdB/Leucine-rich repeat (LRR) protein